MNRKMFTKHMIVYYVPAMVFSHRSCACYNLFCLVLHEEIRQILFLKVPDTRKPLLFSEIDRVAQVSDSFWFTF